MSHIGSRLSKAPAWGEFLEVSVLKFLIKFSLNLCFVNEFQ